MADASNIKVAIESVVHQAIAKTLQEIHDRHGITVREIQTNWYDVSTTEKQKNKLMGLKIETTTGGF